MRGRIWGVAGVLLFSVASAGAEEKDAPTDAQIKQILIEESRADYGGSCPCPYDRDRAGRRCGKRSAYSKPGGEAPLCYDHDVTKEMIAAYRERAAKD